MSFGQFEGLVSVAPSKGQTGKEMGKRKKKRESQEGTAMMASSVL